MKKLCKKIWITIIFILIANFAYNQILDAFSLFQFFVFQNITANIEPGYRLNICQPVKGKSLLYEKTKLNKTA
ncbi:MAG: hypothetical protein MUF15_05995 [Acidobacteria bacterium]|jgi:hypothetical protein|nr:hypothetical protein [Acidobacteriota bacterium]